MEGRQNLQIKKRDFSKQNYKYGGAENLSNKREGRKSNKQMTRISQFFGILAT